MIGTVTRIKKVAVVTTAVAAIGAPAAFAQTDGELLSRAADPYAGMVTDGALLTAASQQYTAQQTLESTYEGMVTDGALLTAAAKKAQPLSR